MYYIYGVSVPSLLIESTDSMIIIFIVSTCTILNIGDYDRMKIHPEIDNK